MNKTQCENHTWHKYGSHWECDTCDMKRTLDPATRPDIKEQSLMEMATDDNPWLIAKSMANKPRPRGENPIKALIESRQNVQTQAMWEELFSTLTPTDLDLIEKSQKFNLVEAIIRAIEKKRGA